MRVGLCSFGSQTRIWRCRSLSSAGDLSTMYDIQACLSPVRCSLCLKRILYSERISGRSIPSWLDLGAVNLSACVISAETCGNLRIVFLVLVVYPASSHCDKVRPLFLPVVTRSSILRGSSSSRFSKNLLPYLSVPIKVPALVSPALYQPRCPFLHSTVHIQAYQCSIRAGRLDQSIFEEQLKARGVFTSVPPFGGHSPA